MAHAPLYPDSTVAELQAFITRAKQALTEARRPDLAERVVLVIREDGRATLIFPKEPFSGNADGAEEVLQFLRIDPLYELGVEQDELRNYPPSARSSVRRGSE